jgi:hypothetical protein
MKYTTPYANAKFGRNHVAKCRRFVTEITANGQSKAYVFEAAALSNASI